MSLVLGFDSSQGFTATGWDWPVGAEFRAQARTPEGVLLATLTTQNGGIEHTAETVTLKFAAATTAQWSRGTVRVDILRVDVTPAQHLGFIATLRFARAVTAA